MLSWYSEAQVNYKVGYCLHDDSKPTTDVANGSCLIEMDTGKVYFFNAEDAQWEEFA